MGILKATGESKLKKEKKKKLCEITYLGSKHYIAGSVTLNLCK